MFILSLRDLRELAFNLAEKNSFPNNFNSNKRMAGKYWLCGLLHRHKHLSSRYPEKIFIARVKGFNRTAIQKFFSILIAMYERFKCSLNEIHNIGHTNCTPHKPSKILELQRKKTNRLFYFWRAGCPRKGWHLYEYNGSFILLMFIFPRVRENLLLMDDVFPGSFAVYDRSRWILKEIFIISFEKFIEFSNSSPAKPLLLILDVH